MSGSDRIELRGLRVLGAHGALPEEQVRAQPFEVDLDLELDLGPAATSDALDETVDYGAVVARVVQIVESGHFRLLEALAGAIADTVLLDTRVGSVTVGARKLRPPVPAHMASAGVRLTRSGRRLRRRAFLGLGANLGDRRRQLADALAALPDLVAASPLYETDPVGGPPGQEPYLNLVAELCTEMAPRELLELARRLESAAGRVRGERWAPRTLDVDVLLVEDLVVDEPDLVVPHPRLAQRGFVLVPLADLAPELVETLAGAGWRRRLGGGVRPAPA